jgi:hypothetical protein
LDNGSPNFPISILEGESISNIDIGKLRKPISNIDIGKLGKPISNIDIGKLGKPISNIDIGKLGKPISNIDIDIGGLQYPDIGLAGILNIGIGNQYIGKPPSPN